MQGLTFESLKKLSELQVYMPASHDSRTTSTYSMARQYAYTELITRVPTWLRAAQSAGI